MTLLLSLETTPMIGKKTAKTFVRKTWQDETDLNNSGLINSRNDDQSDLHASPKPRSHFLVWTVQWSSRPALGRAKPRNTEGCLHDSQICPLVRVRCVFYTCLLSQNRPKLTPNVELWGFFASWLHCLLHSAAMETWRLFTQPGPQARRKVNRFSSCFSTAWK